MPLLRLSPRPLAVRTVLLAIAVIAILPTVVFAGVLLLRYAESERDRAEHQLQQSAQAIARGIDAEFAAAESALGALITSPSLEEEDLPTFERRLRLATGATGRYFALIDRNGQFVINTSLPPGAPMPRIDAGVWRPVFEERRTHITGVMRRVGGTELLTAIGIPVIRHGAVDWVLASRLSSDHFRTIMEQPGIPSDWILSIVDRDGIQMTRSLRSEEYAGTPLSPPMMEHLRRGDTGVIRNLSLEGIPLISTIAYAPRSKWAAAVGIPAATLDLPLHRALRDLLLIGAGIAATVIALVFLLARHLDLALLGLSEAAEHIGHDEAFVLPDCRIREVNAVSIVLAQVSRRLRAFTDTLEAEVEARTHELSDANAKLTAEMKRREASEEQVRQMQKIEAIGQLTGGIAHDFNNMLAIVLGSLRVMLRRMDRGETDIRKYVEAAIQGAERAATLTSRLLAFGRRQPLSPQTVDVNKLVAGMGEVLRRTIPENIHIETVLAGGLWRTSVDAQGLENAIVNLAINARDAMPRGGKLTVETANAHLDDTYASRYADVAAGQYVMVAVTDTGSGMPPEVVSRAFDPFFTTKPTGQGTGLGLSQVHGFIKQSGGHINIYSEPGHGTTVKLYLPRLVGDVQPDSSAEHDAPLPHPSRGVTILIVEDEAGVRALTAEMLRELGYAALEADSGASALSLLDNHPEIALLITDVVMPEMNGRQLAEEAVRRRPDLKVLFTTGYTHNAIVHGGVLDAGVHLLTKPHSIEVLARKIDELLREADAGGRAL